MKRLAQIFAAIGVAAIFYLTGYNVGLHKQQATPEPKEDIILISDTIMIADTIREPVPVTKILVRTDTITTPKDTIFLPIESHEYVHSIENDSVRGKIKVTLSGYDAKLDSLIYDLTIPHETIIVSRRRKWGFTAGPQIGAGVAGGNISTYVGIGITYGFNF